MGKFVLPQNNVKRDSEERIDAFIECFYKKRHFYPQTNRIVKYNDGTYSLESTCETIPMDKKLPYVDITPNYKEINQALSIFEEKGYHVWTSYNNNGGLDYYLWLDDDDMVNASKLF